MTMRRGGVCWRVMAWCGAALIWAACDRGEAPAPAARAAHVSAAPVGAAAEADRRSEEERWPGFSAQETRMIRQMAAPAEAPHDPTNEVSGDEGAARLGQRLFFDVRFSGNGEVACASCHVPSRQFGSASQLERGIGQTRRHPPTLLNAAYQRWFNWDGSADTLWGQAAGPLEHPDEHGSSRVEVVRLLVEDATLRRAYEGVFGETLPEASWAEGLPQRAYPGGARDEAAQRAWEAMSEEDRARVSVVFARALKALAAYQERLVSFDTPFDHWLAQREGRVYEGSAPMMGEEAERGLRWFVGKGRCVTCHTGALLSDMDFHNLGLGPREWLVAGGVDGGRAEGVKRVKGMEFGARGEHSASREGERAQWTGYLVATPEDRGQFKTPGLRGVAQTAPYMHGGHFATLEDVVRFYVGLREPVQVGHREDALRQVHLSVEEQGELVSFLEALSVEPLDEGWVSAP